MASSKVALSSAALHFCCPVYKTDKDMDETHRLSKQQLKREKAFKYHGARASKRAGERELSL
jgi:hypothetical protein